MAGHKKGDASRASVYRRPQPYRANERQPRHIHWSISSRQRRVHAYRSPQPNDRCRRQPDSFGRSTSFTFHDTGANLGCQRERAIQPVRHRQIQSGDERDHQGCGTGCSEKAALEYLVYVHLPIEKTIERTKVRFRRMMDALKSGSKPSPRVDVHDRRREVTADIGVSQVKRFMKDNRLAEMQKAAPHKIFGSMINVVEIQNVSSQHLFFCTKRGEIVMMKPTEFVRYVDTLPDDCIEHRTDKEIRFHLPRGDNVCCPGCGSVRTYVQQYRPQNLHGIPNADKQYVYNRRRYRCQNCGKTFVERSPFLAGFQRRIGNRLRQIRAQKKITQRQVIEALNIPYHAYKSYEDDTAPVVPPTLVAMQIANYLGTDVLEIWGDQLGGGTA